MYGHFATLTSYPAAGFRPALEEVVRAVAERSTEAAALLENFRQTTVSMGQAALEELYIKTFEMRAESAPYVGHQIFEEDWQRGIFMAGLRERYGALGIVEGRELPDHLSMVLRLLEALEPGAERDELIGYCIVPAVRKVLRAVEAPNPYSDLLQALLLTVIPERRGEEPELEETSCRPSSLSLFPILR